MAKEKLKRQKMAEQLGRDALTGAILPEELSLIDTHRITPRAAGGRYTPDNYVVTDPIAHMREHGTYRERDEQLEYIKSLMDDRQQIQKLLLKIQNQQLAYERRVDHHNEYTQVFLERELKRVQEAMDDRDWLITGAIKAYAKQDPLTRITLAVKGVGPITVANLITYVDLGGVFTTYKDIYGKVHVHPRAGQEKCPHASSVWAYVGLDKPSHERHTKGEAGGGNQTLRTAMYVWAGVQIRQKAHPSGYRPIYEQVKARLEQSEKITLTRVTGKTGVHEMAWKDVQPGHRNGAAIRAMIKHFLADYWYVGRTLAGLSTSPAYPEAMLGHEGHRTISPRERGWNWE